MVQDSLGSSQRGSYSCAFTLGPTWHRKCQAGRRLPAPTVCKSGCFLELSRKLERSEMRGCGFIQGEVTHFSHYCAQVSPAVEHEASEERHLLAFMVLARVLRARLSSI